MGWDITHAMPADAPRSPLQTAVKDQVFKGSVKTAVRSVARSAGAPVVAIALTEVDMYADRSATRDQAKFACDALGEGWTHAFGEALQLGTRQPFRKEHHGMFGNTLLIRGTFVHKPQTMWLWPYSADGSDRPARLDASISEPASVTAALADLVDDQGTKKRVALAVAKLDIRRIDAADNQLAHVNQHQLRQVQKALTHVENNWGSGVVLVVHGQQKAFEPISVVDPDYTGRPFKDLFQGRGFDLGFPSVGTKQAASGEATHRQAWTSGSAVNLGYAATRRAGSLTTVGSGCIHPRDADEQVGEMSKHTPFWITIEGPATQGLTGSAPSFSKSCTDTVGRDTIALTHATFTTISLVASNIRSLLCYVVFHVSRCWLGFQGCSVLC